MTYQPTGKTYRLRTLHDVYEQLSPEQIKVCMSEMSILFYTNKSFEELMDSTASTLLGTTEKAFTAKLPEFFEWHDDGNSRIETKVSVSTEDGKEHDEKLTFRIQTVAVQDEASGD